MKMRMTSLVLAGVAGIAAPAFADTIVSATYNDLAGSWNGTTFNANAVNVPGGLQSSGTVARLVAPIGTASFGAGFVSGADPADIVVSLSSTPTADPDTRDGSGSFLITDANGNTLGGTISGQWFNGITAVFFNGSLSNVTFNGATFTGTASGAFSTIFGGSGIYDGAITQLELQNANFFSSNFENVPTQETLQITPAPGAVALLGLGGLAISRRRR
ncbi:MAG: hypothetical protein GC200_09575 [Tepidisphaera sp.]|nr:hypothetical protein [Tepidisphaera sp.]